MTCLAEDLCRCCLLLLLNSLSCLVLSCLLWVQAPAKVVDEVRANLQAQKDQLNTVQQAIADLDL